jgi:hypothetical protein
VPGRCGARYLIAAVLRPWFAARTLDEVRAAFEDTGVSWGPYQTFRQLVEEDPRASEANPMFSLLDQPGIGTYLVPASPLEMTASGRLPAQPAPTLGEVIGLARSKNLTYATSGYGSSQHVAGTTIASRTATGGLPRKSPNAPSTGTCAASTTSKSRCRRSQSASASCWSARATARGEHSRWPANRRPRRLSTAETLDKRS